MQEQNYWVWISKIKGITIQEVENLLKQYGSWEALWKETQEEELKRCVRPGIARKLLQVENKADISNTLSKMQKRNIHLVNYTEANYPQLLKEIYQAPPTVYIKGNLDLCNQKSIAIIGSRNATDYGKRVAKEMAIELAQKEWNIISGLARGIDTQAHIGALLGKGNTIAIVAGGVDFIYPKENHRLYAKILQNGGTIISENGIDTQPEKIDFIKRNRLISGMAKGVLVIEAALKSGTSSTVDYALEQGKDVFAVPGNITSMQSNGTNALIKEGAKCVTEVADILEEWKEI